MFFRKIIKGNTNTYWKQNTGDFTAYFLRIAVTEKLKIIKAVTAVLQLPKRKWLIPNTIIL
jgi:hypothetical protein